MITCCVDCARRYSDCHSKCEAYLQQRAEHEEERAALSTIVPGKATLMCLGKTGGSG